MSLQLLAPSLDRRESPEDTVATLGIKMDQVLDLLRRMADVPPISAPSSTLPPGKSFLETSEFAEAVGRRAFTVREWCRLGRVNAVKVGAGPKSLERWRISAAELARFRADGLLPLDPGRNAG